MRIRTLLAVLALISGSYLPPAAADSTLDRAHAATQLETLSPEACLAKARGDRLAQIDCCKGHKGICGCRAGKIVCCDNTSSTEPGCTCHGDEGLAN